MDCLGRLRVKKKEISFLPPWYSSVLDFEDKGLNIIIVCFPFENLMGE